MKPGKEKTKNEEGKTKEMMKMNEADAVLPSRCSSACLCYFLASGLPWTLEQAGNIDSQEEGKGRKGKKWQAVTRASCLLPPKECQKAK